MEQVLQPTEIPEKHVPRHIKHEENLQLQVCRYLKLQYPRVIFRSDMSSGRKEISRYQLNLKREMHSSRAWPDMFIYQPMTVQGKDGPRKFYGCALELKREGTTIIVKKGARKGHLTSDPHVQEQFLMLKQLAKLGYYANFAVGFDEARQIIDWYMGRVDPDNQTIF